MRYPEFFAFARERHETYLRRSSGKPQPWTRDPILQQFRFTNVFRELDKTTIWFRENVRDRLRFRREVITATIAFRWFNRIETGEILLGHMPDGSTRTNLFLDWSSEYARNRLRGRNPVVTAAYIIKTPNGMNKLDGVLQCIDNALDYQDKLLDAMSPSGQISLEEAWNLLLPYPYMGPFMAYEVITDLRHTSILDDAPDIDTWANPGPGARRGLSRLAGEDRDYHVSTASAKLQELMQEILWKSRLSEFWPKEYGRWEMREVEHTLCEWDKYERARLGEGRPKQRYP